MRIRRPLCFNTVYFLTCVILAAAAEIIQVKKNSVKTYKLFGRPSTVYYTFDRKANMIFHLDISSIPSIIFTGGDAKF